MNLRFRFALFAIFGFAFTLSLGGCKANNSASPTSQNAQPAQSAQSPQQPSASGQPAAPAADQSSASVPGPNQPAQTNGQAAAPAPQAPPPPAVIQLPAGTHLRVRLDSDLSSGTSHPGDSFTATVADDVVVNGQTIIPRGARAEGTVVDAKSLGHFKGGALLSVRLEQVHTRWGTYPVATSSIDRAEKGKGKRSAGFIGGGAGFGALIGGLAGAAKGRPSARWQAAEQARPGPPSLATSRLFCLRRPCSRFVSSIRSASLSSVNRSRDYSSGEDMAIAARTVNAPQPRAQTHRSLCCQPSEARSSSSVAPQRRGR